MPSSTHYRRVVMCISIVWMVVVGSHSAGGRWDGTGRLGSPATARYQLPHGSSSHDELSKVSEMSWRYEYSVHVLGKTELVGR